MIHLAGPQEKNSSDGPEKAASIVIALKKTSGGGCPQVIAL
jgi:hypothetical protein